MSKKRRVEYVVGSFLCFPIVCVHEIEEEETASHQQKPMASQQKRIDISCKSPKQSYQQGVKRTCGNSQKSVRMKHKE